MPNEPLRLVGTKQIREMLAITRSRCGQIVSTKGFPDPVATLGAAHVWLAEDVEEWAASKGRDIHPYEETP